MGQSRTVSEIKGNFSRNSQIFPTRRVTLPLEKYGIYPLELGITMDGLKKLEWRGYQAEKKFDDVLSVVWQTDG